MHRLLFIATLLLLYIANIAAAQTETPFPREMKEFFKVGMGVSDVSRSSIYFNQHDTFSLQIVSDEALPIVIDYFVGRVPLEELRKKYPLVEKESQAAIGRRNEMLLKRGQKVPTSVPDLSFTELPQAKQMSIIKYVGDDYIIIESVSKPRVQRVIPFRSIASIVLPHEDELRMRIYVQP